MWQTHPVGRPCLVERVLSDRSCVSAGVAMDLHGSGVAGGLTTVQAQLLLAENGLNSIPDETPSVLARLMTGLWAPVPWMLEATVVLELVLGRWLDAAIVGTVLAFNAGLGCSKQHGRRGAGLVAAAVGGQRPGLPRRRLAAGAGG